jgi:signal transduction histidine kinase
LVADGVVATLVCVASLAIVAGGGFGESPPSSRPLDAVGVALLVAMAAPLVARRAAPLAVFTATSAVTLVLLGLSFPLDLPLGPLVGGYTVGAAYGGARPAVRAAAMVAVAGFVPATMLTFAAGGYDVTLMIVPEMLAVAVLLAGVWIAGDRARLRRERVAELEDRARRAEREAERERRVAAAEERLRLARELHDSAGHAINVILVQAGAARLLHERDPDGSRRAIGTIEEVARKTIGEIDRLVRVLRAEDAGADAVPVDPTMLPELVEHHRAGGLWIAADLPHPPGDLPPSLARAAYRILQEALTNAARHGRGSAGVTVRYRDGGVDLTVTNPAAAGGAAAGGAAAGGPGNGGGHGITGMRERATLVGGALEVDRVDGTFRLHALLPHPERPPRREVTVR